MRHVLVVGEEALARRVAWVLEESGYSVEPISDAQTALQRAKTLAPDAILVNGVLPADQMPKFALQLRAVAPDACIIDMMGKPGGDKEPLPAEAHLTQPFDADDLLSALNNVLDET